MHTFTRDMFGNEAQDLDPCPGHPDLLFDILFGGIEPARQFAAEFQSELVILHELNAPEDHDTAEGVRPAALVAHTVIDDRE